MVRPPLTLLGATGFVGRHFLNEAAAHWTVTAVARSDPPESLPAGAQWARMRAPGFRIENEIEAGAVVVNLAFDRQAGLAANRVFIRELVEACERRQARCLIHCSTAAVVGMVGPDRIDETSPCRPRPGYEAEKLQLEWEVRERSRKVPWLILRPTAVVGAGGQNLVKLARQLTHGAAALNCLRRSLYGRRPMHLVPVGNVSAALRHLAGTSLQGETFIVASDDEADNRFDRVEHILRRLLKLPANSCHLPALPPAVLSTLLWAGGRPENLARRYAADKLASTGFTPPHTVRQGIAEFADGYLNHG